MKKIALLISLATLVLMFSNRIFAEDVGLAEQYRQALTPRSDSMKDTPFNQVQRGVKTRGLGGVKSEFVGTNGGNEEPILTLQLEFKFNSDELTPQTVKYLGELGKALQSPELKGYIYKIEGHTDNAGSELYNLELSKKRAIAVSDYLIKNFTLERKQFDVKGFGKKQPVASNETEDGRSKNRRVVIKNTLKPFIFTPINKPEIIVKVKSERNGEVRELVGGEILTQLDGYSIELAPKSSAHVYVYQIDAIGKAELLFPNASLSQSYNAVEPDKIYRIPDVGKWLTLDNNKGIEKIVVIAKKGELKESLEICKREIGIGESEVILYSANTELKSAEAKTRGLKGVREEDSANLTVSNPPKKKPPVPHPIDMSNIFVWKFSFVHQ